MSRGRRQDGGLQGAWPIYETSAIRRLSSCKALWYVYQRPRLICSDLIKENERKITEQNTSEEWRRERHISQLKGPELGLGHGFPRKCLSTKFAPITIYDDS